MPFKRFNPCLPCCCYRTILVICIYDESSPVYTVVGGLEYATDKAVWDEFIDGVTQSHIRVGLMAPQGFEANLKPSDDVFPRDTDREVWDTVYLSLQSPRVKQQDILDFFELIRTNPTDEDPLGGANGPDLLLFCLDNSGSILTSQYESELSSAKATLEELWPKMKILDDISNAGERYLRDAYTGTKDRTCG